MWIHYWDPHGFSEKIHSGGPFEPKEFKNKYTEDEDLEYYDTSSGKKYIKSWGLASFLTSASAYPRVRPSLICRPLAISLPETAGARRLLLCGSSQTLGRESRLTARGRDVRRFRWHRED